MHKHMIKLIGPGQVLYRDTKTGLAWVEDTNTGTGYSAHPNISSTGSIKGMRNLGYWGLFDRVVCSHGFYYNVDMSAGMDDLSSIARQHCHCGGKH
jgi:hypothetical protein